MRPFLKYGIAYSVIMIILMLVIAFTNTQLSLIGRMSGLIGLGLLLPFVFLVIRDKRNNELNGVIGFKDGIKAGMQFTLTAVLFLAFYTYFHLRFLQADFLNSQLAEAITITRAAAEKMNKTTQELNERIELIKRFYTPYTRATAMILPDLLGGLFFSLVVSAYLSRARG